LIAPIHKVLIVDDEPAIRRGLRSTLNGLGFESAEAARGEEALSLARTARFDAILLDLKMPGIGGVETCRRIRQILPRLPILVISVNDSEDGKVEALDAGADDYITKPFSVKELMARLRSAIRRAQLPDESQDAVIAIGDIELHQSRRLVLKSGRPVHLTPKQFDLLRFLMCHSGRPVPHERLLRFVWGNEYQGELEYLRTFMSQIRKKIEDDPANPKYLLTDAYVGYRFCEAH
jgi:two-component system, OmpR family, KDP operon response regulator KdpE